MRTYRLTLECYILCSFTPSLWEEVQSYPIGLQVWPSNSSRWKFPRSIRGSIQIYWLFLRGYYWERVSCHGHLGERKVMNNEGLIHREQWFGLLSSDTHRFPVWEERISSSLYASSWHRQALNDHMHDRACWRLRATFTMPWKRSWWSWNLFTPKKEYWGLRSGGTLKKYRSHQKLEDGVQWPKSTTGKNGLFLECKSRRKGCWF